MRSAAHELRVQLAAHPVAYPLLRGLGRIRPAVRVPGLGVLVNDAGTAQAVMRDGATYRRGGGPAADVWTQVFGPSVLLNMDGDAHQGMRRKLKDFFSPGYVKRLCADMLTEPLSRIEATLAAGEPVDVVDATRVMSGAMTSALTGFEVTGTVAEREDTYRSLVERVEVLTGMVKLNRLRLADGQVARARAIADEVGAVAGRAWAAGDDGTAVGRMRQFGLSEVEARGLASAMLLAGTETISSLIPRLVALLHDEGALPAIAAAVRDGDRITLDGAFEEAARLITPTPVIQRYAAAPARIGAVAVRAGERVLISTANCARAYGRFDLTRPHPPELRRLWFGAGPHFCLGYPLAMAQTHAIVGAILAGGPVRVAQRRPARGAFFPAYRRLDVVRG